MRDEGLKFALEEILCKIEIKEVVKLSADAEQLINAAKNIFINGKVYYRKYHFSGDDRILNSFDKFSFNARDLVNGILNHNGLQNFRQEFSIQHNKICDEIHEIPSFGIRQKIIDIFSGGGAYKSLSPKLSKEIVNDFFANEFGSTENLKMYEMRINSDWFMGVAWDYSFLIFDFPNSNISILSITDTD